jgi:hypothetical protein
MFGGKEGNIYRVKKEVAAVGVPLLERKRVAAWEYTFIGGDVVVQKKELPHVLIHLY